MSLADPSVLFTDNEDGSAEFTVTFADDDYKFSASVDGDRAVVQYEETLSWRGNIQVAEPDDEIFKALMVSDEMTEFLETYGLTGVIRGKRQQNT